MTEVGADGKPALLRRMGRWVILGSIVNQIRDFAPSKPALTLERRHTHNRLANYAALKGLDYSFKPTTSPPWRSAQTP